MANSERVLDPLVSLQVPKDASKISHELGSPGKLSNVSSVCFLQPRREQEDRVVAVAPEDPWDSESDDDDDSIELQCQNLAAGRYEASSTSSSTSLTAARMLPYNPELTQAADRLLTLSNNNVILATAHASGHGLLWDVAHGKPIASFADPSRGPGMSVQRCGGDSSNNISSSYFCYQSRDVQGTVSLHDAVHNAATNNDNSNTISTPAIASIHTHSQTFCTAAAASDHSSLIALPCGDESAFAVRDWRVPPHHAPILEQSVATKEKSGMLTSLALVASSPPSNDASRSGSPADNASPHSWVVCGMESGSVVTYDLTMPHQPVEMKLSRDPILGLDAAARMRSGIVVVAGMAGDATDLQELVPEDRGTVGVVQTMHRRTAALSGDCSCSSNNSGGLVSRLSARLPTCRVGHPDAFGKPGVNLCRFRPDGRLFAVGGWDHRLRLFSRSSSSNNSKISSPSSPKPLAILRGHTAGVTAVDWMPNLSSGILATGGSDGKVLIWKCYPGSKG